ncbi:hypothetical protein [Rhizorhabdus dicambivorans]|uniref:hypothetical protein n=1 Tax=Rhizorhabdus dicambivorans TaxID=1850238 RepID=UPI00083695D8|nr:hypothetical protein [Rhizorhabdus dicambivorans]ATE66557.1 hypothetical protein CMV14_20850 [Rhizorhabdus dicambivorans]
MASTRALAREIAAHTAPVAAALIRRMLWRGLGMSLPMEAHRIGSRGIFTRSSSSDAAQGVTAFLEKRATHFSDRMSRDMPGFFP